MTTTERIEEVVALADRHGLTIAREGVTFNDAGLDYQVAFAQDEHDADWVLRIPRRPDVSEKIAAEATILDLVKGRLAVAVPDWRIHTRDLIAYPSLPGRPGLTLTSAGEPEWHFDPQGETYARSFGEVVAALHSIDPRDAGAAGIPSQTAGELRDTWRDRLRKADAAFEIDADLRTGWEEWLADEGLWPEYTTFTHGELYPAHLLLSPDGTIESVLDWTTAQVGDPAVDFALHHMIASPETFQRTVDTYTAITGRVPARLAERCAAVMAAGPLAYAIFALESGDPQHAATAQAMLMPGQD